MDAGEPGVGRRRDLLVFEAEHRLPAIRIVDLVALEVPVPDAVVGAADRQGVALFAVAQGLLRLAAFADVLADGDDAHRLVLIVEYQIEEQLDRKAASRPARWLSPSRRRRPSPARLRKSRSRSSGGRKFARAAGRGGCRARAPCMSASAGLAQRTARSRSVIATPTCAVSSAFSSWRRRSRDWRSSERSRISTRMRLSRPASAVTWTTPTGKVVPSLR